MRRPQKGRAGWSFAAGVAAAALVLAAAANGRAATIFLQDGTRLEVQGVWQDEKGDYSYFKDGKIYSGLQKSSVSRIAGVEEPPPAAAPAFVPPAITPPAETLKRAISEAVGKTNRAAHQPLEVLFDGTQLSVTFAVHDNLTAGMIRLGAMHTVAEILRAAAGCPVAWQRASVAGTFPLQDKYGREIEQQVVVAAFRATEVRKVAWERFPRENVYQLADSLWVHPAFR